MTAEGWWWWWWCMLVLMLSCFHLLAPPYCLSPFLTFSFPYFLLASSYYQTSYIPAYLSKYLPWHLSTFLCVCLPPLHVLLTAYTDIKFTLLTLIMLLGT